MIGETLELLAGEVRIRVRGASIERFLNACARGGIGLRRTCRMDFGELHATVSVRDFRRLRPVIRRTGCRVHILARHGAPFVLHRLRRRYVLFAGFAVLGVLFWALTSFVWVVEIHAQPGISTYHLRETLHEAGAYAGIPIAAVDETAIREYVRREMEDTVDFVTVSRIGNVITVEAFGGDGDPETLDDKAVTGVVASRDGLVTEVQALGGYPLVGKGDVVQRGQLLISAVTPPTTEAGLGHIGHGWGQVKAQTSRSETSVRLLNRTKKRAAGRKKTQYAIVIGGKRLNLYLGSSVAAGNCDKKVYAERVVLGRGAALPVTVIRQEYTYYEPETAADSVEETRAQAEQNALSRMQDDMQAGVVEHWNSEAEEVDGALRLTLHAACTEDIGREISQEGAELPEKAEQPEEE